MRFDIRFVAYEAERVGQEGPQLHFIDTLRLARRLLARDRYQLGRLLRAFDIVPEGVLHTALGDARATRALFWKLVARGELDTLADAGVKPPRWATH